MVIVRIVGGLGNQMFQYAYAKSLEQKGYAVKIDISKFKNYKLHGGYQLKNFRIDLKTSSTTENFSTKLGFGRVVKEKSLKFNPKYLELPKDRYVKGYFQTEKYFKSIRPILLKQFIYQKQLSESTIRFLKQITIQKNSCAVHIRRGDYVTNEKANSVHGTCDLQYYQRAAEYINSKQKNIRFFIFSDDIQWVKKNLNLKNAAYIEHDVEPQEDLLLMSLCRHNITANSSFSWWGAWLNQHEHKMVISPKQWFVHKENEVACENWIQL